MSAREETVELEGEVVESRTGEHSRPRPARGREVAGQLAAGCSSTVQ
jgi:hypothetical protein